MIRFKIRLTIVLKSPGAKARPRIVLAYSSTSEYRSFNSSVRRG